MDALAGMRAAEEEEYPRQGRLLKLRHISGHRRAGGQRPLAPASPRACDHGRRQQGTAQGFAVRRPPGRIRRPGTRRPEPGAGNQAPGTKDPDQAPEPTAGAKGPEFRAR
jgi:hypothetical protein